MKKLQKLLASLTAAAVMIGSVGTLPEGVLNAFNIEAGAEEIIDDIQETAAEETAEDIQETTAPDGDRETEPTADENENTAAASGTCGANGDNLTWTLDDEGTLDEKSADVRIAQYESGTRTPKQALVELLAEALDVNPCFLVDDEILGAEGVMMMLFELDEHYPISIEDCGDEDGNRRKGVVFGSILMTDLLSEWQRRKKHLADGKISKAEYTEWKLNWPKTTDDCGKHEPAKEWHNL